MFHRHLTLERYELTREENPGATAGLRDRASRCTTCKAAIAGGLDLQVAWPPPAGAALPLDWHAALATAIAPDRQPPTRRTVGVGRLAATTAAIAILLAALAVPAAASSGPGSLLYPVRGAEEDVRWSASPVSERPRLEADFAAAYLWQARSSADRKDRSGYQAAMSRVFLWAGRLKTDVTSSPQSERAGIRATLAAGRSLLPGIAASGVNQQETGQVESILNDVEGESQQGDGNHTEGG